ncbi:MAG: DUF1343 domain-containing protein, partial [bacterium]
MTIKRRTPLLPALLFLFFQLPASLGAQNSMDGTARVSTGLDVLLNERAGSIMNKRLAVVTNHTGRDASGESIVALLTKHATVSVILSPEHGFQGSVPAGADVAEENPPSTAIPVFSLYGEFRSPTSAMLKDIDLLIYDIQDVGARFYTYISTLYFTLEACAREEIPILVLDRPNPITGDMVEGPVTRPGSMSFVGIAPISTRHGMTVGELAMMFNTEHFIGQRIGAHLQVVPMRGWSRSLWYDQIGLPWIPPSPNMPTLDTAIVYPGTCLFEGTNMSEGRGTPRPFELIGAPWINGGRWAEHLNTLNLPGV